MRRRLFIGACLAAGLCSQCRTWGQDSSLPKVYGCYVPAAKAKPYFGVSEGGSMVDIDKHSLKTNSASADLDYAFAQALGVLCRDFEVEPAFSYYDEGDGGRNAKATPTRLIAERPDGTVLFGLKMLSHLLDTEDNPSLAIVAVAAHEFGHIVAIKRGLQAQLVIDEAAPFRGEQFADFMCGYFAGLRHKKHNDYPAIVFANAIRRMASPGDTSHGSASVRGRAVSQGFNAAELELDAAVQTGFNFAMASTDQTPE